MEAKGEIILYKSEDGNIKIDVLLQDETVWLTQNQMAGLFQRDRTVIYKHIRNIYEEDELTEEATCAKIAQVQKEGDREVNRIVDYYNLDVIISVGYRVKLTINEKEILTDAGRISHNIATQKAETEYNKYKEHLRALEKGNSLNELIDDISKMNPKPGKGNRNKKK